MALLNEWNWLRQTRFMTSFCSDVLNSVSFCWSQRILAFCLVILSTAKFVQNRLSSSRLLARIDGASLVSRKFNFSLLPSALNYSFRARNDVSLNDPSSHWHQVQEFFRDINSMSLYLRNIAHWSWLRAQCSRQQKFWVHPSPGKRCFNTFTYLCKRCASWITNFLKGIWIDPH